MRSKQRTDAEWMTIIQECRSSGFSDRVWCEQNNISIHTFYNMVAKLRKKSCAIPKAVTTPTDPLEIVPLSVVDEGQSLQGKSSQSWTPDALAADTALVLTINGCSVAISNNAGRDVICHTLSALHQI